MNADFCSSMLRGLGNVHMSDRERARAEDRVRKAVAFVECMSAIAVFAGIRKNASKHPA